jgi:hypothetical protein
VIGMCFRNCFASFMCVSGGFCLWGCQFSKNPQTLNPFRSPLDGISSFSLTEWIIWTAVRRV